MVAEGGHGRNLAASLKLSERTLLRWAEQADLSPPRRILAWMRETHGRTRTRCGSSPPRAASVVQDGLKAMRKANLYDAFATTFEMTQFGGFMVGVWDFGNCLWDEY